MCLLVNISYSQTYTFSFSTSDFSIVENNGEHTITAPIEFLSASKICTPILPSCIKRILLPPNKKVSSYTVTYNTEHWQNNILLKAMPVSYPTDGKIYPNVSCSYDLKVYPDSIVRYGGVSTIDHYRCVGFVITPFVYNATNGSLSLVTQINISLSLVDDIVNHSQIATRERVVKQLVHNPEDISRFYPQTKQRSSAQNIDYLIITKNSLKESFEPLRIWKTQKGVYTKIITVEEIDSIYANAWNTQQLRIKQCIKHFYDSFNTEWVLLGGDETIIPAVMAYTEINELNTEGDTIHSEKEYIPADLFYACFGDYGEFDWNANGNNIIGELVDNVDMNPLISLSRLPIRTKQHADTYIEKLLHYEQEPTIRTASMLLCAQRLDTTGSITEHSDAHIASDVMKNNHIMPYWDGEVVRFYDTGTDFPGNENYDLSNTNLTVQLSSNKYNMVHFMTHGDRTCWRMEHNSSYCTDNVVDLTNNNPFFVFTTACHTNAFDLSEPCLSEAFIRKKTGGAIAYWGGSRYGWRNYSNSWNGWYFAKLFLNVSHNFATLVKYVQLDYGPIADYFQFDRWLLLSNNAIGDAEVPIYTTIPNKFKNVTVEDSETTLTINTGGVDSCTITISNIANGGNYYVTFADVNSATFTNVPNDYTIVVTKDNYIPYIYGPNAPQPICHITTEIINDERIITGCDETRIGGLSDLNIEIETRTFDNNMQLPIDSSLIQSIRSGEVKITNTGSLEVINGGTVTIEYLTMEDGAGLKIH